MCNRSVDWSSAIKCREEQEFFCKNNCSVKTCQTRDICSDPGHPRCWDAHLPDNALRPRHKPINYMAEIFIHCATHSESNPSLQKHLHEQDAVARWFDVDHEERRLHIYHR